MATAFAMATEPLPDQSRAASSVMARSAASGLPAAVSLSPTDAEAVAPTSVLAAVATFPDRRAGLRDVTNSDVTNGTQASPASPPTTPSKLVKPSPSPVRAVAELKNVSTPSGETPRTRRRRSLTEQSDAFSELGAVTPAKTDATGGAASPCCFSEGGYSVSTSAAATPVPAGGGSKLADFLTAVEDQTPERGGSPLAALLAMTDEAAPDWSGPLADALTAIRGAVSLST